MEKQPRVRLFLDSNVLTAGLVSRWGLDKAILSICAANIGRLVLAEAVREEVEENLLLIAQDYSTLHSEQLLQDYQRLIELSRPEIVPFPEAKLIRSNRHLIRHEADVPVLLSAVASKPDWFLTHNLKHFNPAVGQRTGLRIATPIEFFRTLSSLLM